jgi:hypothetical protein
MQTRAILGRGSENQAIPDFFAGFFCPEAAHWGHSKSVCLLFLTLLHDFYENKTRSPSL